MGDDVNETATTFPSPGTLAWGEGQGEAGQPTEGEGRPQARPKPVAAPHALLVAAPHPNPLPVKRRYGKRGCVRRLALAVFVAALTLSAAALTAFDVAITRVPPLPLGEVAEVSTTVLDRHGALLRAFITPSGHWRLPATPETVDPRYLAMLTAFEDRRFNSHHGVDFRAFARASTQLLRHGRIVSGGSTLTMQVARLVAQAGGKETTARHSGGTKLRQIVHALQLERQLDKRAILSLYLKLAPFGGNMEGVRAASLAYFGKEPRHLTAAEAALLVAIPQSPETRRPDRSPVAARRARDRVLARAVAARVITQAEFTRAKSEPVPAIRRPFPQLAPHLAEAERARSPAEPVLRLTLDRDLQRALESLARDATKALGDKLSAAILVADNKTGEILAHVGSAGYLDDARFGAIDMANAIRSPGSTLKPLIYGLGFEAGLAHPETLIEDRPVRFGTYSPKNFDEDFHGTVTIREALSQSLNIPAVKMLNAVGPGRLVGRFARFGLTPVLPAKAEPTVAIALGGIGLTLHDLATMYTSLARGGEGVVLRHVPLSPFLAATVHRRLLSPVAAWYVADILKDSPPPPGAIGGRIAYKTGTSYGSRDAYAIGFDGAHTVAVWVGRPDSAATAGLTGRTAAAPLLFDAFARLGESRAPLAAAPSGAVIASNGAALPPPLKRFKEPGEDVASLPGPFLEPSPVIAFPPDRSEVEVDAGYGDAVVIKAEGGALPLTWLVDGEPIPSDVSRREAVWQPAGRGFTKLSVIDAKGKADRVTVRVR